MHEVSIMSEALRLALNEAAGAKRITVLRLRIGVLSGVVPEAMRFAWDVISRGTMAEGGLLEIEAVMAKARCGNCSREFTCADYLAQCPGCGQACYEFLQGREMEIASIDAE